MTVTQQLTMIALSFGIATFVNYFVIYKRNKLFGGLGFIGLGLGLTQITNVVPGADAIIVVPVWLLIGAGTITIIWEILKGGK